MRDFLYFGYGLMEQSGMKKRDMHDEFIDELYKKVPKRADLINLISDILKLEKESIYRRLAGKVNFTVREVGILAKALQISLDNIIYRDREVQWIPIVLESPNMLDSMDGLCARIDMNLKKIEKITSDERCKAGAVHNSLPLEFYATSPLMLKFMFFKWGNYFVKSEEFTKFSDWELPAELSTIEERCRQIYKFQDIFYIWDSSLVTTLVREIENFYWMNAITGEEKEAIKNELKTILIKIEQTLNGTYDPILPDVSKMTFYVSSISVGFMSGYIASPEQYFATFHTNFSFSVIEAEEGFIRIKEWIKSLRDISTLLSKSGKIERRQFFETQHKIIDQTL